MARPRGARVLDAFPAFEAFWERAREFPVARQVALWEREMGAAWPDLLAMQVEEYARDGVDWRRVARTRVFPHLEERLPRMGALRKEVLRAIPGGVAGARRTLGVRFPVTFVIHVGIGCGAGWATRWAGRPAVLLGLENAAELHDPRTRSYSRIVPHEMAHLAHQEWRREALLGWPTRDTPWWHLYEEGFATQAEREALGPASFRMRTGDAGWLAWCEAHRTWLARRFLADVGARRSVRPFFGSWYPLRGQIETGYYLGAEVVRGWRKRMTLQEIAVLPLARVGRMASVALRSIADKGAPR